MTDRNNDPLNPNAALSNERVVTAADNAATERVVHAADNQAERVVHAAPQAAAATPERVAKAAPEHQISGTNYQATALNDQETLYLYEERARVDVSVESQGQVALHKKVVEHQEMIPVTIRREILEIVTAPGNGTVHVDGITLDGQQLEAGRSYEIVLTEERAHVTKQVFPVQEVSIRKQQLSEQHTETVTLRREVLEVDGPAELIHERERQ